MCEKFSLAEGNCSYQTVHKEVERRLRSKLVVCLSTWALTGKRNTALPDLPDANANLVFFFSHFKSSKAMTVNGFRWRTFRRRRKQRKQLGWREHRQNSHPLGRDGWYGRHVWLNSKHPTKSVKYIREKWSSTDCISVPLARTMLLDQLTWNSLQFHHPSDQ